MLRKDADVTISFAPVRVRHLVHNLSQLQFRNASYLDVLAPRHSVPSDGCAIISSLAISIVTVWNTFLELLAPSFETLPIDLFDSYSAVPAVPAVSSLFLLFLLLGAFPIFSHSLTPSNFQLSKKSVCHILTSCVVENCSPHCTLL